MAPPTLPFPQPPISESDQTILKAGHLRNKEAEAEGLQVPGSPGLAW